MIVKRNRQLLSVHIVREFAVATLIRQFGYTVSSSLHKKMLYARKLALCLSLS